MRESQRREESQINNGTNITVDSSKNKSANYFDRSLHLPPQPQGGIRLREVVAQTELLAVVLKRGRCVGWRLNQAPTPADAKDPVHRAEWRKGYIIWKKKLQWLVVSKMNPYWKQAFPFPSTSNVESRSLEAEAGGKTPGGKTDIKRQLLPIAEVTCDIPPFRPEGVSSHNCLSQSVRPQWHGCRVRACLEQR